MSEVRSFFRFCPACGRRFHVRLVGRELDAERNETVVTEQVAVSGGAVAGGGKYGYAVSSPIVVEMNIPVTVSVKDFQ
jgi:hypothetical protein